MEEGLWLWLKESLQGYLFRLMPLTLILSVARGGMDVAVVCALKKIESNLCVVSEKD